MKFKLIYPKWPKLSGQTEFHLPPHGPVVFAAALPDSVSIDFTDENLESINFEEEVDFVGISMMLTVQVKRGWEIADRYRKKGIKVIFGGIATMLHVEETMLHADAVFLGEAADFIRHLRLRIHDAVNEQGEDFLAGPGLLDFRIAARGVPQVAGEDQFFLLAVGIAPRDKP